jgi:hypothetical protein
LNEKRDAAESNVKHRSLCGLAPTVLIQFAVAQGFRIWDPARLPTFTMM